MNIIKYLIGLTAIVLIVCLTMLSEIGHAEMVVNGDVFTTTDSCEVTVANFIPNETTTLGFYIDFGDGSQIKKSRTFSGGGTMRSFTASHVYAKQGTFTIKATSHYVSGGLPGDLVETKVISVVAVIPELPRGVVGDEYSNSLRGSASGGNNYRLVKGKLPPGLDLDHNGTLAGVPTQKGKFTFTVRVSTIGKAAMTQDLVCYIDPGKLVIETTPQRINLTVGGTTPQRVTFTIVHPTVAINETIRSNRGEFVAAGRVLGTYNAPLSINLNTIKPVGTETITVPENVLMAAQQAGINQIVYRRNFTSQNLRPGSGETNVSLRTSAAGELRITKMRVYFEQNNRPLIMVQRNERDLTGAVEIQYDGSGTFKGYWHVDGRILQRVQQNIFYGKVLTLKTPQAPPLPTYSEGAHRLQFIVTEPVDAQQRIDFPEAIYHVEAKQAEIVVPITIVTPKDRAEINADGTMFNWSEIPNIATYYVEFFKPREEEPYFTAYTTTNSYELKAKIISLRFTSGTTYRYRVRGFNSAGDLAAKSGEQTFTLTADTAYVPSQIIFVVDNDDAGRSRILQIAEKYDLKVLDQTVLVSLNRIMVICSSAADIPYLSRQLLEEEGLYASQPNFVFSTMGEHDPLRSMQCVHQLLDLDRIQQKSSGKNILVAVIDTGVDLQHQDLQDRVKAHYNLVGTSSYRGEIHGTAVAGIIAGARNEFGILGIAPDASLLALRACEQKEPTGAEGICYSTTIAKALDTAIIEKAAIANLSLGSIHEDPVVSDLIVTARREGMLLVAPVGNDALAMEIAFPASHPDVTAVAGLSADSAPLPNRTLALAAAAVAPAQHLFSTIPGDKHNFMDGTSFAAAVITGLTALSLETHPHADLAEYPRFDDTSLWQSKVVAFIGQ